MAIEINGAGTIDGIAVGGLNDGIITDAELNLSANASNIKTALNASGDAPIYACRAWVNFDGTTTVPDIRASGNVSSVTRNGTGDYTVNFTTAMPDADYSVALSTLSVNATQVTQTVVIKGVLGTGATTKTTLALGILVGVTSAATLNNSADISASIFR